MVHFIMLEGLRNTLIGFIFDNQSEAKITQSLDSDQLSKNGPQKDASALTLDGSKVTEQKGLPLNKPAKAMEIKSSSPQGLPVVRPFIKPLPARPAALGEMSMIDAPMTVTQIGAGS